MWTEKEHFQFYFAATHQRARTLLHTTVEKMGSDPSLSKSYNCSMLDTDYMRLISTWKMK